LKGVEVGGLFPCLTAGRGQDLSFLCEFHDMDEKEEEGKKGE